MKNTVMMFVLGIALNLYGSEALNRIPGTFPIILPTGVSAQQAFSVLSAVTEKASTPREKWKVEAVDQEWKWVRLHLNVRNKHYLRVCYRLDADRLVPDVPWSENLRQNGTDIHRNVKAWIAKFALVWESSLKAPELCLSSGGVEQQTGAVATTVAASPASDGNQTQVRSSPAVSHDEWRPMYVEVAVTNTPDPNLMAEEKSVSEKLFDIRSRLKSHASGLDFEKAGELDDAMSAEVQAREMIAYRVVAGNGSIRICQCLPERGVVLASRDTSAEQYLANRIFGDLGAATAERRRQCFAVPVMIRTTRPYSDGQPLAPGFYVFEGTKTESTTDGSTMTVKVFRDLGPDCDEALEITCLTKRLEEIRKAQATKSTRPRGGYVIELPKDTVVKSLCGLKFGYPPVEVESHLGKRIPERLDGHVHDSTFDDDDAFKTFLLKKPFRVCDRVRLFYRKEDGITVLASVKIQGYVDLKQITSSSCREEVVTIAKMLCRHFGSACEPVRRGSYDNYFTYVVNLSDNECITVCFTVSDGCIEISYDSHCGDCNYVKQQAARIHKWEYEQNEKKKRSIRFNDSEGEDML